MAPEGREEKGRCTCMKAGIGGMSPVFVLKEKYGKWRMVTDLTAVNKVIQPMGQLQSGIPLLSLLPKG